MMMKPGALSYYIIFSIQYFGDDGLIRCAWFRFYQNPVTYSNRIGKGLVCQSEFTDYPAAIQSVITVHFIPTACRFYYYTFQNVRR